MWREPVLDPARCEQALPRASLRATRHRFLGIPWGDKMINQENVFGLFGPPGPPGGLRSPGNGPGSKNSAGCTKNQPRRPILSPICGHFVFLGPITYKVSFWGEEGPLWILGFGVPLEAKSFVRAPKIGPPGAQGRVFDLTCRSCGRGRRCTIHERQYYRTSCRVCWVRF